MTKGSFGTVVMKKLARMRTSIGCRSAWLTRRGNSMMRRCACSEASSLNTTRTESIRSATTDHSKWLRLRVMAAVKLMKKRNLSSTLERLAAITSYVPEINSNLKASTPTKRAFHAKNS